MNLYRIKDLYYDIKQGLRSLIRYFPIVWKTRDWDYYYLFEMQKFQLELLLKIIKKGHEIDETRIPKEKDIQRCIDLIDNINQNNYFERCGFVHNRVIYKTIPHKDNPSYPL